MKKIEILAVVSLLMMFGCSKDALINTEQDFVNVEENSPAIINGEQSSKKVNNSVVTLINFYGTSNESGGYYYFPNNPITDQERKLAIRGNLSGKIPGIGSIKSSLSIYDFSSWEKTVSQKNDTIWCDYTSYKLTANGKISTGPSDYCFINISGYSCFIDTNYSGFSGIAETYSGVGKFKNFKKIFKVYSFGITSPGINLSTGEIKLQFSEYVKY